jgi:small subunit ribosomal protein S19
MRSKWKFVYSNVKIDRAILAQSRKKFSQSLVKVYDRGSTILPLFIGQRVLVHQGMRFVKYLIKEYMVGHKFGEFALTKHIGEQIHITKKNRKKELKK